MRVVERIERKIAKALVPVRLEIVDQSHLHAGHVGARPEGETYFRAEIVSASFDGKSRVARQRMVYALLAEELAGPIHALDLKTLTPSDDCADA